ncbi:MAG: RagB/SusD family nutrient uptake outer membrane protein, partial [Sphingobacteriales bacterium]
LTPTKQIDESNYVARSSVKQVYDQVIADLTDAVNKMPESNGFFANKYAASAILARVYLQKGDYANAANAATDVISADAYELNEDYADEFPNPGQVHVDDTPEDIFAIQITTQTGAYDGNTASYLNTNWMNAFYASADNAGRGEIIIKDSFLESFEEGDERLTLFNPDGDGFLRVDKFNNVFGNVHIIRLAELYLIRAEANLRISGSSSIGDTPLNDVNMIRDRANLEPLAVVTINNVLTERLHELAFEGGFFLHDARRNKQNINNLPYNSPKLVFPIPLREINANPKLVQNPGYSSN